MPGCPSGSKIFRCFQYSSIIVSAQTDAETLRTIYTTSLTNGKSYEWLDHLSNQIGGRLSGSLNAENKGEQSHVMKFWNTFGCATNHISEQLPRYLGLTQLTK